MGAVLLVFFGWVMLLSVTCDRGEDITQNWRRWTHIQWAAGACVVLASPSWQFAVLFCVLASCYWLPYVEAKSGAFNDWFIKVYLFAAFYVIVEPRMEAWMLPWLLLAILACGTSVAFWIAVAKWKGPAYKIKLLGREFHSFEIWPERDEPTPGGINCQGRMMNSVHSGAFGSVCLFAGLGLGVIWSPWWMASAALGAFIMWGSGTRGGALNVGVGAAFWAAARGPHWDIVLAVSVIAAVLAVFMKVRDWSWGENISSWRFQVWRESVRLCLGNPIRSWMSVVWWVVGRGPFGWKTLCDKDLFKYGDRLWITPHNEFVHILCEHGLLGLGASLLFISWSFSSPFHLGGAEGAAYMSVAGALIGTAVWSFPWRGTALVESLTGQFFAVGTLQDQAGAEKKILQPQIHYGSAGAPIFTWLSAIWAALGPNVG